MATGWGFGPYFAFGFVFGLCFTCFDVACLTWVWVLIWVWVGLCVGSAGPLFLQPQLLDISSSVLDPPHLQLLLVPALGSDPAYEWLQLLVVMAAAHLQLQVSGFCPHNSSIF